MKSRAYGQVIDDIVESRTYRTGYSLLTEMRSTLLAVNKATAAVKEGEERFNITRGCLT